jgi:hypothetical protein
MTRAELSCVDTKRRQEVAALVAPRPGAITHSGERRDGSDAHSSCHSWESRTADGRTLLLLFCALALFATAGVSAHPGHNHTVMGTVKSFKDGHLEVEAKDGKVSTFMLTESTKILRGKTKVDATEITVGARVVAIGVMPPGNTADSQAGGTHAAAGMIEAKEIRLAAKPAAPPS